MKAIQMTGLVLAGALLAGAALSLFTVNETQHAVVLQFGKPVKVISQAGLHARIPFIQEVRTFDKRILSVDPQMERMTLSSDKSEPIDVKSEEMTEETKAALEKLRTEISGEPINVEVFARYKIVDPLLFMQRMVTEEGANQRIRNVMDGATRDVLGGTTLRALLSAKRTDVMLDIKNRVNAAMKDRGVEIVDIRIVRADLTDRLRTSTVSRMITERKERATETRAVGDELAKQIRAEADRQRTVLLADAQKQAQIVRGQGDAEAIKVYNQAYSRDKDFYTYMRTLEAYRNTLATPETRLILSPDGQFLKYLEKP